MIVNFVFFNELFCYTSVHLKIQMYLVILFLDAVQSQSLVSLHRELCSVDATLARIETELGSFQRDLRSISREIQHLQTESVHMNIKLKNRKVLLLIKLVNMFFLFV